MAIEPAFGQLASLVVLVSDNHDFELNLSREEECAVSRAVGKRRNEFAAGRSLARQGLRQLGLGPVSIPMSPHRYPLWPDGIVGSISHTHRYVGVALARTRNYLGLGLDLEVRNSVTPDLFESILVGSEMKQLSTRLQVELATVLFSCKEAIFKAVNPVFDEFIDFLDVEVDVSDGRFRARCSEARHSAELVNGGEGYFEIVGEIVKSLFLVHANPRAPA